MRILLGESSGSVLVIQSTESRDLNPFRPSFRSLHPKEDPFQMHLDSEFFFKHEGHDEHEGKTEGIAWSRSHLVTSG